MTYQTFKGSTALHVEGYGPLGYRRVLVFSPYVDGKKHDAPGRGPVKRVHAIAQKGRAETSSGGCWSTGSRFRLSAVSGMQVLDGFSWIYWAESGDPAVASIPSSKPSSSVVSCTEIVEYSFETGINIVLPSP